MAQAIRTPRRFERGSPYGADGFCYPVEEERAVPLSERALRLIAYLYEALRLVFRSEPNVYVGADQFMYWEPGNTLKGVSPDVYVIRGVPKEPPRAVIRIWEEATPSLVVEVSSSGSRKEDREDKFTIYQDALGCPEYLIWDEDTEELLFYRLEKGAYRLQAADALGRFHSMELGLWFAGDPEVQVRVFGPDGEAVPTFQEMDERCAAVSAENERLRSELERLRQDRGE